MGRRPLSRNLGVWMNGRRVGRYRLDASGGTGFQYDQEWLDWRHAFPVSRQLPLDTGMQTGSRVNAVFENLLPDSDPVRQRIAERTEARSPRPHDLLAAIGRDCVGAMQFLPDGEVPRDPFVVAATARTEAEIAERLRNLTVAPLGIVEGEPFRISLAGAQEKTAYLLHDGAWCEPVGMTPTTHIFKRPMGLLDHGIDMSDSVENEFLCLEIVRAFGIEAAEAEMARFEDQKALVVKRFDRTERRSGGLLRLPQEDFLQAMGLESGQKYEEHGGPGMARCLELLAGAIESFDDQKTFLQAQIVFWMIDATDGHAKNFSTLLGPDGFRLTPIYDVLSAAPALAAHEVRRRDMRLAMAAGDSRHYRLSDIQPRHFDQTAARARVPRETRSRVFLELAERADSLFDAVASRLPGDFPDRVAGPILERGRGRARVLEAFVEHGGVEAAT